MNVVLGSVPAFGLLGLRGRRALAATAFSITLCFLVVAVLSSMKMGLSVI